ncbi:MAG: hypothetical protein J6Q30_04115, partial [Oscillospiraceae bacterium]|nr:hypothetical protein [Oscillospiraceae bacterium]
FSEKIPRFRFAKLWYACHRQASYPKSLRYARDDSFVKILKLPEKWQFICQFLMLQWQKIRVCCFAWQQTLWKNQ